MSLWKFPGSASIYVVSMLVIYTFFLFKFCKGRQVSGTAGVAEWRWRWDPALVTFLGHDSHLNTSGSFAQSKTHLFLEGQRNTDISAPAPFFPWSPLSRKLLNPHLYCVAYFIACPFFSLRCYHKENGAESMEQKNSFFRSYIFRSKENLGNIAILMSGRN